MFGAYVRENRKVVIALAVYTAVFGFIFWLYRLPLGAVGASEPKGDIFGTPLAYRPMADSSIELTVKAGQSYLLECR